MLTECLFGQHLLRQAGEAHPAGPRRHPRLRNRRRMVLERSRTISGNGRPAHGQLLFHREFLAPARSCGRLLHPRFSLKDAPALVVALHRRAILPRLGRDPSDCLQTSKGAHPFCHRRHFHLARSPSAFGSRPATPWRRSTCPGRGPGSWRSAPCSRIAKSSSFSACPTRRAASPMSGRRLASP